MIKIEELWFSNTYFCIWIELKQQLINLFFIHFITHSNYHRSSIYCWCLATLLHKTKRSNMKEDKCFSTYSNAQQIKLVRCYLCRWLKFYRKWADFLMKWQNNVWLIWQNHRLTVIKRGWNLINKILNKFRTQKWLINLIHSQKKPINH